MSAETVSSVVFARFTTSEALPVAKIGNVVNHVHDLGFAQQIMSRVHGKGDVINPYVTECGYKDLSGNAFGPSAALTAGTTQLADASHLANTDVDDASGGSVFGTQANSAQQISWARSSADLSGVFQGRHCLNMESFLNTWYEQSQTVNVNKTSLEKALLIDRNNQSGAGPIGWFGVDDGTEISKQKKHTSSTASTDWAAGDVCKEVMGVCLTSLTSTMRNNTGFNVQTQVMTNILSDLGIDVDAENEVGNAADKLDSVSYLRLANYLGKHTNLKAVVEDSNVNSGDSMTKNQLFYELAKQFDVNNKVHDTGAKSTRESDIATELGSGKGLTKLVKTELDKNTDAGLTAAQTLLEKHFTDLTQFESGRVAIAFLYKSQTQGVRDTEVRVHMKVCGGVVNNASFPLAQEGPGSYEAAINKYTCSAGQSATVDALTSTITALDVGMTTVGGAAKHVLTDGDKVGRTFEQMCTVHPLMQSGRPLGVFYA